MSAGVLKRKPGLTDRGMATDILVKTDLLKKNGKNPVCGTVVWSLASQFEISWKKKKTGLTNRGMPTDVLVENDF